MGIFQTGDVIKSTPVIRNDANGSAELFFGSYDGFLYGLKVSLVIDGLDILCFCKFDCGGSIFSDALLRDDRYGSDLYLF